MTTSQNKFAQALTSSRLLTMAECFPPRSGGAEAVKKLATVLPASLDAVVVADNPDEIRGSALACAALLAREGHQAVLTMNTRDRNRIALESDALGASALGIDAVLCLSGNHQSLGGCPQAGAAYDIDSTQLLQIVKNLALPAMLLGAVAHPHQQPLELNLWKLRKKLAAGADFVITQPVLDLGEFTSWLDAVRAAGFDQRVAIIASVLPFASVEQAEVLQRTKTYGPVDEALVSRLRAASDAAQEGLTLAVDMAAKLKSMPGVRGINILCGGSEALASDVIKAAGLA